MPRGLVAYWSAYSDASFLPAGQGGPWRDLVGKGDLRFDGGAAAPRSDEPGARGFDLGGFSLTGPPSVDLLPTAGQDFTLAWAGRDPAATEGPATLVQLWGNSQNNGGLLVVAGSDEAAGKMRVAAAVGDASTGVWDLPYAVGFRVFALVLHGPTLSLFVDGARVEPDVAPGPADPALLMSNKPARVNPDGAWAGRLGALALWSRALQDFEVGVAAERLRNEAGDRPRLASSCDARVAEVRAALDASERAMADLRAQNDAVRRERQGAAAGAAAKDLKVREGFADASLRLETERIREAAADAVALLNGGADLEAES